MKRRIISMLICAMVLFAGTIAMNTDQVNAASKTKTYTKTFSKTYGKKSTGMWFTVYSQVQWKVKNGKITSIKYLKKGVKQSPKSKLVGTFGSDQRNKYYVAGNKKKGYAQSAWGYRPGASSSGGYSTYYVIDAVVYPNGKSKCVIKSMYAGAYPNYKWGWP